MTENSTKNLVMKLALLGNPAVGKTSLINKYIQHSFSNDYQPTLGVNIVIKEFKIEELNAYTRLVLWDIAGQAKYELSRRMFFQGCMGALLIYDVTRPSTFEDIKTKWLKDYQDFTEKNSAYILIGNKIDLVDSKAVSTEEGKSLAEEINAIDFLETSAKFGDNVENAFRKLVNQVLINSHLINNRTK